MNFTELEIMLSVGFVVLLWRISVLERHSRYYQTRFVGLLRKVVMLADGQAIVRRKDEWTIVFSEKQSASSSGSGGAS